jgi:hypothetical protein
LQDFLGYDLLALALKIIFSKVAWVVGLRLGQSWEEVVNLGITKGYGGGIAMSALCFGSYAKLIKAATSETNEGVVNMLFDAVATPLSLRNKVGDAYYIGKEDASRLLNCKLSVPLEIQRSTEATAVKGTIVEYFKDKVVAHILKSTSQLLRDLVQLINSDAGITDSDKKSLLAQATEGTLTEFLVCVFLYAVQQPNDFSKKASVKKENHLYEFSDALVPDISIVDKFHLRLLIEAKGYCPNDNCGEQLFITKNGKTTERFKATRIKADASDTFENLIALCPKCHDTYAVSPTPDETLCLQKIKAALMREASAFETASEIKIEAEIDEVLSRIASATESELVPLTYKPVKVTRKIRKENGMLLRRTLFNVTTYFNYVKDVFQQLGKEGRLRFDSFAVQVKLCYLKECGEGRSQEEIYGALVEWLRTMTNGSRDACDVVVAYFVQNCEVFDEIAE